jgi:hypothetical protein
MVQKIIMLYSVLRVTSYTAFFHWIAVSFAYNVIINYIKLLLHVASSFVTAVASDPGIWKENVNFLYLKIIFFYFPKNFKEVPYSVIRRKASIKYVNCLVFKCSAASLFQRINIGFAIIY